MTDNEWKNQLYESFLDQQHKDALMCFFTDACQRCNRYRGIGQETPCEGKPQCLSNEAFEFIREELAKK